MTTTPNGENAALEAALERLAESPQAITRTARVRRMLPKIEAALSAGSTLAEVHQTLVTNGWAITEGAFRGAFYRARKTPGKGGMGGRKGGQVTAPARPVTPPPGQATGPDQVPKKRGNLELKKPERKFEWDPLARPVIAFIDKPTDPADPPPKD